MMTTIKVSNKLVDKNIYRHCEQRVRGARPQQSQAPVIASFRFAPYALCARYANAMTLCN
ncbi:hypothetical protein BC008_36575 [Mastigocoleus testarum BC008]|uniref:Uncharacterized protein n=1 Tax=Mastigocoleus testarum BC008 TaxID=371196 RepID=A0A0V7ZR12_9CYAN|nr:hypothetical protein BC008_26970 [Mastigocoleus testarum BC008]KST70172.1 hypothetical protein BC008_36575 [Mastigocoleus testarum BC008]